MGTKLTLDGYEAAWRPVSTERKTSKLQQKAVDLIKVLYPSLPFCIEVKLPIHRNKKPKFLFGDIYIRYGILIEVNGDQHNRQTHYFHKNRTEFDLLKQNEELKRAWCDLNGIMMVVMNHDEPLDIWSQKIKEALR